MMRAPELVCCAAVALALASQGVLARPALAEVQLLEAVGVAPVRGGDLETRDMRDAAVKKALREAVLSVARQLLIDASREFEDRRVSDALGNQALPYTTRYRIVDDQGERPTMFDDDADVASEYVVVVEVSVETDLVGQRLVEAGLLETDGGDSETTRVRVEVEGLLHYPAYVAMRELIRRAGGAVSVHPVEFARGRAVLDVELPGAVGGGETEEVVELLVESGPPELEIEALRVEEALIVLAATWTPPLPEPTLDPDDGSGRSAPRGR